MAPRYEVEVTVGSAYDLKNVNWRNGDLKPYAVVWIDGGAKCSTKVDVDNNVNPCWDEKLLLPLPPDSRLEDAVLHIDVVHAGASEGTKPLVGSARLHLRDVIDDAGIGGKASRTLKLKRPSGRPHGKLDVRVAVKEPSRYYDPYAPPPPSSYGQPAGSRDYRGEGSYGSYGGYGQPYSPYGAPPSAAGYAYPAAAPPVGYPYGGAPPATAPAYGQASGYGSAYGSGPVVVEEKKKSKFGMGTGLAVGAAAGVLGGLALAEGANYVEDKIEDHVAERVEDDLAYNAAFNDEGGYGGDDGDYGGDDF